MTKRETKEEEENESETRRGEGSESEPPPTLQASIYQSMTSLPTASSSSGAEYDLLDPLSQALSLSMLDSIVGGGGGVVVGGGGIGGVGVGAANDDDADAVFPDFGLVDAAAVGGDADDAFETFAIDSDDDDFSNLGNVDVDVDVFAVGGGDAAAAAPSAESRPPPPPPPSHWATGRDVAEISVPPSMPTASLPDRTTLRQMRQEQVASHPLLAGHPRQRQQQQQQQQQQEQQRTQVAMVSSSAAKCSTQLGGTGGRGSA